MFWPVIRMSGYGLDFKEMIVLGYSGLRGALALILALIISVDQRISYNVSDYILFHTCGISLLTIIINGNTTGFLIKTLGLQQAQPLEKVFLNRVVNSLENRTKSRIQQLKQNKHAA